MMHFFFLSFFSFSTHRPTTRQQCQQQNDQVICYSSNNNNNNINPTTPSCSSIGSGEDTPPNLHFTRSQSAALRLCQVGASASETPPLENPTCASPIAIGTRNFGSLSRLSLNIVSESSSGGNDGEDEQDSVIRAADEPANVALNPCDADDTEENRADEVQEDDESASERNDSADDESVLSQNVDSADDTCDMDSFGDNLEDDVIEEEIDDDEDEDDEFARYSLDNSYRLTRSSCCSHKGDSNDASLSSTHSVS